MAMASEWDKPWVEWPLTDKISSPAKKALISETLWPGLGQCKLRFRDVQNWGVNIVFRGKKNHANAKPFLQNTPPQNSNVFQDFNLLGGCLGPRLDHEQKWSWQRSPCVPWASRGLRPPKSRGLFDLGPFRRWHWSAENAGAVNWLVRCCLFVSRYSRAKSLRLKCSRSDCPDD